MAITKLLSNLSKDELIQKTNSITERYNTYTKYKFEGKVNVDSFIIYPTFDLTLNFLLRPEIKGKIIQKKYFSIIELNFGLSTETKFFLISVLVLNLVVYFLFLFFHLNYIFPKFITWGFPIGIIGFITNFIFHLRFKINNSKELLMKVFKAKEE